MKIINIIAVVFGMVWLVAVGLLLANRLDKSSPITRTYDEQAEIVCFSHKLGGIDCFHIDDTALDID